MISPFVNENPVPTNRRSLTPSPSHVTRCMAHPPPLPAPTTAPHPCPKCRAPPTTPPPLPANACSPEPTSVSHPMPQVQGSSPAAARERMLAAARAHFRPEFLNRLDAIVAFEPLSPTQLVGVARLMAAELGARLAPKNISLRVTEAALKLAVQQAYDPVYGARPIRRWLVSG